MTHDRISYLTVAQERSKLVLFPIPFECRNVRSFESVRESENDRDIRLVLSSRDSALVRRLSVEESSFYIL